MRIIGITGGIGTGKSTVTGMLVKQGAVVINADEVGHDMLGDPAIRRELVRAFGGDIIAADGEISRPKLAAKIFGNPEAVARLNAIMHPRMLTWVHKTIADYRERGEELLVIDAPLLIEVGWTDLVDEVWVTEAPREVVIQRVSDRSGLAEAEITARIDAQADTEMRRRHADVVLDTARPLGELETEVHRLLAGDKS